MPCTSRGTTSLGSTQPCGLLPLWKQVLQITLGRSENCWRPHKFGFPGEWICDRLHAHLGGGYASMTNSDLVMIWEQIRTLHELIYNLGNFRRLFAGNDRQSAGVEGDLRKDGIPGAERRTSEKASRNRRYDPSIGRGLGRACILHAPSVGFGSEARKTRISFRLSWRNLVESK